MCEDKSSAEGLATEALEQGAALESPVAVVRGLARRLAIFCDSARDLSRSTTTPHTARQALTRAFGTSLLDMSWTLATMLVVSPARTHVTCLTMWRPLYERWLRMGYFVACASEFEIAAFSLTGALPKSRTEKNRKGEPRPMSARELSSAVSAEIPLLQQKFEELEGEFNKIWSDLVHGGIHLVRLHGAEREYESNAGSGVVVELIYRVAMVTTITTSYIAMQASNEENSERAAAFKALDAEVTDLLRDCHKQAADPNLLLRPVSA